MSHRGIQISRARPFPILTCDMVGAALIPIILLKTRSQPHDNYQDHFAATHLRLTAASVGFEPVFVPVLEHKQDEKSLGRLGELLRSGALKEQYGGMIFTSQRAVEGWADTIQSTIRQLSVPHKIGQPTEVKKEDVGMNDVAIDTRSSQPFKTDILTSTPFPLYTVGPATSRALTTLVADSSASDNPNPFAQLHPVVVGAHTGNGQALAHFILSHYNALYANTWFTYYEAPRLPFIPLVGMGSENYSRKRLESSDPRLRKSPLLFLVGETRRDIIPKTLMNPDLKKQQIEVEEMEVYSTTILSSFRQSFDKVIQSCTQNPQISLAVVVVFSPQGSGDMLSALGYTDETGKLTNKGRQRWTAKKNTGEIEEAAGQQVGAQATSRDDTGTNHNRAEDQQQIHITDQVTDAAVKQTETQQPTEFIIVTIGPTTRDHLRTRFGFEPDVCAKKPSPEGIAEGLAEFIKEHGM